MPNTPERTERPVKRWESWVCPECDERVTWNEVAGRWNRHGRGIQDAHGQPVKVPVVPESALLAEKERADDAERRVGEVQKGLVEIAHGADKPHRVARDLLEEQFDGLWRKLLLLPDTSLTSMLATLNSHQEKPR